MAVVRPEIVITQNIPDTFYTYEKYDLVYSITRSISPTSVAVISYQDTTGSKVEVYNKTFTEHPAKIEDLGSLLEPYVKSGKREFTLLITSNTTWNFTKIFSVDYIAPALVIKEGFDEFAFSSALDHVTFGMIGTRASYSAKFELCHGTETILSETYVPDINNEITIRDLSSLINPYLQDSIVSLFEVTISVQDTVTHSNIANLATSFTALFCKLDINMSARDFTNKFFLSTLMGDKVTAPDRKEYIHLGYEVTDADLDSESGFYSVTMQVFANYVDEEWKKSSFVFDKKVELSTLNFQIATIDVSPNNFDRKGFNLVSYTVEIGSRKQSYVVDTECPDTDPAIAFINSFGCLETVYFTGTKELEPSFKRNAAYINGIYKNYYVEEDRNYKANTGVLPESMLCLIDELARSTETFLIEKQEIGRRVTITDSETKRDNNWDSLYSASMTYRIANRNQNILSPLLPNRTFDKTFDNTFR